MARASAAETSPAELAERPIVVYVMGAGRSGSTILGVALGNCQDFFFAGELNKWLARAGTPSLEDPERVRFWSGVREDMEDASDLFGGEASCLERSSALFQLRSWPARRRLRRRYRRIAENLYLAIARATGAGHIVDTSHYPLRARELQALGGIDLHLLYLVREPHSVVASLGRKDVPERSFGMLASNAYLWLTHFLSVVTFLRHPRERRLFVRHEAFRADPAGVLRQILTHVDSSAATPELKSLRTGVPLHGNRLIRDEFVSIEAGETASHHRSLVTTLLQLPWTVIFSRLRPAVTATPSRTLGWQESTTMPERTS